NVPLQLVIDSNKGLDPDHLDVNQIVSIPGYLTDQYKLKEGDTFWKIATGRRMSLETLLLVNPEMNPQVLSAGQSIQIPMRIRNPIVSESKPYDYESLMTDIRRLVTIYPFLSNQSIVHSVVGKNLCELQIGAGSRKVHM